MRLFFWRGVTQLLRSGGAALRDVWIICIAGTVLGLLFEGTLEKARCDGTLANVPLPHLANYTRTWEESCKAHLWGRRSW